MIDKQHIQLVIGIEVSKDKHHMSMQSVAFVEGYVNNDLLNKILFKVMSSPQDIAAFTSHDIIDPYQEIIPNQVYNINDIFKVTDRQTGFKYKLYCHQINQELIRRRCEEDPQPITHIQMPVDNSVFLTVMLQNMLDEISQQ